MTDLLYFPPDHTDGLAGIPVCKKEKPLEKSLNSGRMYFPFDESALRFVIPRLHPLSPWRQSNVGSTAHVS